MWPFGHTTSGKLRDLQEELDELRSETKKRIDVLEFEWADWYGKFRLLHARLSKQEKKAARDGPGAEIDEAASLEHLPNHALKFPHSRRGW
jgi:hypothetical protein